MRGMGGEEKKANSDGDGCVLTVVSRQACLNLHLPFLGISSCSTFVSLLRPVVTRPRQPRPFTIDSYPIHPITVVFSIQTFDLQEPTKYILSF